jgi:hypothetical protein
VAVTESTSEDDKGACLTEAVTGDSLDRQGTLGVVDRLVGLIEPAVQLREGR